MTTELEVKPQIESFKSPIEILRESENGLRVQLARLHKSADSQSLFALVSAIAYLEEDIRRLSLPEGE